MEQIIYKTRPRLFILCTTLLGFLFFGLLFWLTYSSAKNNFNYLTISILTMFAAFSLMSLFYLLTIKTIKLKNQSIDVSYFLLPFKKTIMFKDIKNIEQKTKAIKALYGVAFKTRYIYSDHSTIINLTDNKSIKLNSIGQLDFKDFYKTYNKIKRGEGKIKEQKNSFSIYVIDNLDGILWLLFLLILTVGLGYGMLTRQL